MFWFSDKLALKARKARPLAQSEAPELYRDIEEIAGKAGLPMPRVYLIPSEQPNAFATGRSPKKAAVAVTEGLLRYLPREQVKGVLAHEIGHIANRDILVMTIAAMIGAAIAAIANILQFSMFFGGGDDDDNPLGIIGVLAAVIVAPLAAMILQLAVSRQREYLADATAAQYLGEGRPLAEALATLQRGVQAVPMNVNPATEALYIANPLSRQGLTRALLDAPADGGADQPSARARRRERHPLLGTCAGAALAADQAGSRARAAGAASRAPDEEPALVPSGPPRRPLGSGGVALELPEEPQDTDARGREWRRRRRTRGGERLPMAATQEALYGELDLALSWSERELPSASGRSTSTGCIRTSASSCRSSSRRCSSATCGREAASSTRSPARERRSCRRSSPATTRSESTSPRSTRSSCGQDARARPRGARAEVRDVGTRLGRVVRAADRLRARVVRAAGRGRAAALPLADRGVREPGRAPGRARARRALGPTDDALRPRLPARAAAGRVLVPQAPPNLPPGRERAASSSRATCPTRRADPGLRRGARPRRAALVLHGDARELELGGPYDGVVTSPPYPGLIDYHEQHRYAYELLGLDDRREREVGAAARGTSQAAIEEYVAGIAAVLARVARGARAGRAGLHRRQRPPRPLPGDPRASGPAARGAARAARQPAHGPPRGRVLRVDPDRVR